MRKLGLVALVLTLAIATILMLRSTGDSVPDIPVADTSAVVRIGYPVLRIALPVFIAADKGFFAKHGVTAELVRFETAQPMMDALVSGAIDVAGYTALPITFAAIVRSRTRLAFITAMLEDDQHPISMLLARNGSGIARIDQLVGKRIGILPTRAYELWLSAVLTKAGVDPRSVIVQQIPPPQQVAALQTGSIDALFTNDPAATAALASGAALDLGGGKALVPNAAGLSPFYFGSFNVTAAFLATSPDVVRRISLALDDAIAFLETNPEAGALIMANYLPSEQRPLAASFPRSRFGATGAVSQADLDAALAYYRGAGMVTGQVDLGLLQYQRPR